MTSLVLLLHVIQYLSLFHFSQGAPPLIKSSSPPSVTLNEHETLRLSCEIVGKPEPQIRWRKDGQLLKEGKDGVHITKGEMTITSLTPNQAGNYECQGHSTQGQVEHITTVYVRAPPIILIPPLNQTINEGKDATFNCKATGFPQPIEYRWLFNGKHIRLRHHKVFHDGTFFISGSRKEDRGLVTCQADNGYGQPSVATAFLTVRYKARALEMPAYIYGGLNLSTVITCLSDAEPLVSVVRWKKNKSVIVTEQNDRISIDKDGNLTIKQTELHDEGNYTCTPYNILGTTGESRVVRLMVREPPHFTLRPRPVFEVELGRPLKMRCMGAGDPDPTLTWRKVEPSLVNLPNKRVFWNSGNLTITSITKQDHGVWRCLLSNAVAVVTSDVIVNVKYTLPHHVTNLTVTTSYTKATVSWLPGYNGGYTQHFAIWYKQANQGDHKWLTVYANNSRKVVRIERLEPDTFYQFSILSENVLGSGRFSNMVTTKTKARPVIVANVKTPLISPPRDVTYKIHNSGLVVLSWKAPHFVDLSDFLGYLVECTNFTALQQQRSLLPTDSAIWSTRHKRSSAIYRRKHVLQSYNAANPLPWTRRTRQIRENWRLLGSYDSSVTSCEIPRNKIFRDEIYKFHVIVVSFTSYSEPSIPVIIDTTGMMAYPIRSKSPSSAVADGTLYGIVSAVILVVSGVTLAAVFCYCRQNKLKSAELLQRHHHLKAATRSFLTNQNSDSNTLNNANSKNDYEVTATEVLRNSLQDGTSSANKNGVLRKIKTKFENSNREINSRERNMPKRNALKRSKSAIQVASPRGIPSISRSDDGKFRLSTNANHTSLDRCTHHGRSGKHLVESDSEEIRKSYMRKSVHGRRSRPVSDSFIYQVQENTRDQRHFTASVEQNSIPEQNGVVGPTLEIDCSHKDVAVRYINQDATKGTYSNLSLTRRKQLCFNRHISHQLSNERSKEDLETNSTSNRADFVRSPAHEAPESQLQEDFQPLCTNAKYVYLRDIEVPDLESCESRSRCCSPCIDSTLNNASSDFPFYDAELSESHSNSLPGKNSPASSNTIYQNIPSECSRGHAYSPDDLLESSHEDYSSFSRSHGDHRRNSSLNKQRKGSLTLPAMNCLSSIAEEETRRYSQSPPADFLSMDTNKPNRSVQPCGDDTTASFSHSCSFPSLSLKTRNPKCDVMWNNRNSLQRRSVSGENIKTSDSGFTETCNRSLQTTSQHPSVMRSRSLDNGHLQNVEGQSKVAGMQQEITTSVKMHFPTSEISNSFHTPPFQVTNHATSGSFSGYENHCAQSGVSYDPRCHGDYRNVRLQPHHYMSDKSSACHHSNMHGLSRREFRDHFIKNHHDLGPIDDTSSELNKKTSRRRLKEFSSVDDNYEWDSETAIETEILEAVRKFRSHKSDGEISKDLLEELSKLNPNLTKQEQQLEIPKDFRYADCKPHEGRATSPVYSQSTMSSDSNYSKENMERRCAALKEEYFEYQRRQRLLSDIKLPHNNSTMC